MPTSPHHLTPTRSSKPLSSAEGQICFLDRENPLNNVSAGTAQGQVKDDSIDYHFVHALIIHSRFLI